MKSKRNYGWFTDLSKDINYALGDRTDRSVSRRTAQGLKRTFNSKMHDDDAEDVAHAAMVATGLLLKSKNDNAKVGGLFMLFGLFICYQNGQ